MANVRRMSKLDYENQVSWIIDTAETPQQQKNLKKDLAALKKKYTAGRVEYGMKKTTAKKAGKKK